MLCCEDTALGLESLGKGVQEVLWEPLSASGAAQDAAPSALSPLCSFAVLASQLLRKQMIAPRTLGFTRNFRNPPRPVSASVPFLICL